MKCTGRDFGTRQHSGCRETEPQGQKDVVGGGPTAVAGREAKLPRRSLDLLRMRERGDIRSL